MCFDSICWTCFLTAHIYNIRRFSGLVTCKPIILNCCDAPCLRILNIDHQWCLFYADACTYIHKTNSVIFLKFTQDCFCVHI